nr:hypothetical protein CFP56_56268 [Quercus suber]
MLVVEANVNHHQRKLKEWSKVSFGNISWALVEKKQQVKAAEGEAVRSGEGSGMVISPPSLLSANAKVADLIDADLGWWNVYLLERVFLPFVAQKIKSIPLCLTPQEDTLIWPKTKDGQYLVKLGYQLLCARENSGAASGSTDVVNRKMCCNREPETVIHALWGCEKVKVVWGTNFDELHIATNQALSFVDLFSWCCRIPVELKVLSWFAGSSRIGVTKPD